MTKEKFATNLAIYIKGNTMGVVPKEYKELRQLILDYLERQDTWVMLTPIEDDC